MNAANSRDFDATTGFPFFANSLLNLWTRLKSAVT
jgi:hypothetical protein